MASSPTQRTLALYKERGYLCEVTEKWNAFARIRQDLFGFIDVLAIKEGEVVGVQATSWGNVKARINKIADHDNTPMVRKAGIRIIVIGWGKDSAGKWRFKEIDCS